VSARRVVDLEAVTMERVRAHQGAGEILRHRPFSAADFAGDWHFVDYAILPPGASIGVHTHGDDEELYLVLEGRATMHLDGRDFPVTAGTLILNRPGGTHGLRNDSDAPVRLLVVEVGTGTAATEPGDTPRPEDKA
jgi:mannose-6-phosphate isomerase-like protein (cupin superfamily)